MAEKYFDQRSARKHDLNHLLNKRSELVELMLEFEEYFSYKDGGDESLIRAQNESLIRRAQKYNEIAMNLTLIIISEFGATYREYEIFEDLAEKSIEYQYKLNRGFFNK